MTRGGYTRQHVADAIDEAGEAGYLSRAYLVLPQPADDRAHTQEEDGEGKVELYLGFRPVLRPHEGNLENAPAINRAQADLHDDGCNGNAPAIGEAVGGHRSSLRLAEIHFRKQDPTTKPYSGTI